MPLLENSIAQTHARGIVLVIICGSVPLQVDDRVPVRSWGNGCAPIDGWQSLGPDERLVVNVEVDVERKWVRTWLLFHYTRDSLKNNHI